MSTLGAVGARALPPGLAANGTLECLDLDSCHLGDTGASLLLETLQGKSNLLYLSLQDNGMTMNALPHLT